MDRRNLALIGLAIGSATLSGAAIYQGRHSAPPPVLITTPASAASTALTNHEPASPQMKPAASTVDTPAPAPPPEASPVEPPATPTAPGEAPATSTPAPPEAPQLFVHVAGAVKRPDMYHLPAGSRVYNAIKAAGGAANSADLDAVNLAEPLSDGEKVYIPRKGETPDASSAGNSLGHGSSGGASAVSSGTSPSAEPKSGKGSGHAGRSEGAASNKLTSPSQGTVNINTASAEELERLPGIGPAMAGRILAFRKQNGRFRKLDDLLEVSGIGEKKLAKMAPFVKL